MRSRIRASKVLLIVSLFILTLSCSSEVRFPAKVILVGIDAADFAVMEPLLDEGKLPNFSRLISDGSTGKLETLIPLEKSPILWTSIATGMLPEKHGIGSRAATVAEGDTVLYTGNVRRVKAVWNILGEAGMRVAVVGWLVTWPAEEVSGYMVSDYIQYETEKSIKFERQTFPEALFDEIDQMRVTQQDVVDETIAELYPVDAPTDVLSPQDWKKDYVKMIYATDETFSRIALWLHQKDVDFLAVYFNGIDSMCHSFWDFRSNSKHPLSKVIDNYYLWMDRVLGEFMDLADDETLLVVCSDHGFHGPRRSPDGTLRLGVHVHGRYGIIGFMGNCIREGHRIVDADILDVTPTILYALGLPVGKDMDGRVLTDAFDLKFLRRHPVTFIPTYETEKRLPGKPLKSPVDEKIRERLRALGYIQ